MTDTKKQLRDQCDSIAEDIENPPEITEEDLDYYPDAEIGETLSVYDYLRNAMNIKFTCSPNGAGLDYESGSIAVAIGGPHIEIVTNSFNNSVEVKGYWGSDQYTAYARDNMGVDDYLEEIFNINNGRGY